jgi:hypothetical protein
MEKKSTPANVNDAVPPIPLTSMQFGIKANSVISLITDKTELNINVKEEGGQKFVTLNLSMTLDNSSGNIIFGPTLDTKTSIGRFDFPKESKPGKILNNLTFLAPGGPGSPVRLTSSFDLLTTGIKIEHGHAVSVALKNEAADEEKGE